MRAVGLIAFAPGIGWNLTAYAWTGDLLSSRYDLQSVAAGMDACLSAATLLLSLRPLERLRPYSFTIYLYHVFGSSPCRRILLEFGVASIPVHLVLGVAAGFAAPTCLHMLAARWRWTRAALLGMRTSPTARQARPLLLASAN